MKNHFFTAFFILSVVAANAQPCGNYDVHIQNYIITPGNKWLCLELADDGTSEVFSDDKKIRARIIRSDYANKKDLDTVVYMKWNGWHYTTSECKFSPKYATTEKFTYKQLPCASQYNCYENCFNSKMILLSDSSIFIVFYLLNDFRNTYYIVIDKNDKIKNEHIDLFQSNDINSDETYRKIINEYALKNYPALNKITKGKLIWDNYSGQFSPDWSDSLLIKKSFKGKADHFTLLPATTHHKDHKELTNTVVATEKWNIFLNGMIAFHQGQPLQLSEDKNYYYIMLYDWQEQTCYNYPNIIPVLYKISKKEGRLVKTFNYSHF